MTGEQIQRVGLIANTDKPNCREAVLRAVGTAQAAGRTVLADHGTSAFAGLTGETRQDAVALAREVDMLLVLGGDGTMLHVAREVADFGIPLLGINTGGLGFLTASPSELLDSTLSCIWDSQFAVETRSLIEASGSLRGGELRQIALNDFVISRGAVPRLIELKVAVDDAVLTEYRCDGLIVSAPTGSTAYSLAAGGPIVTPDAEVFALTPISPHTLSNRSVIINLNSTVQVTVLTSRIDTILSADGQVQTQLSSGDQISIRRSGRIARFVRLVSASFFETLRQKLRWSGSGVFRPLEQ